MDKRVRGFVCSIRGTLIRFEAIQKVCLDRNDTQYVLPPALREVCDFIMELDPLYPRGAELYVWKNRYASCDIDPNGLLTFAGLFRNLPLRTIEEAIWLTGRKVYNFDSP